MIVFDVRFLRLDSRENCGLSCRYSQLYDSKSELLFRDNVFIGDRKEFRARWKKERLAGQRGIRSKENDFAIENTLSVKTSCELLASNGCIITSRIMQTTVYVRMPSADAA